MVNKGSSEWPKMLVPNRPSKMPETKTSKRKEGANAFAALLTYSPQKEAAPKLNNTYKVWRLYPKRVFCWTRLHIGSSTHKSWKSAAQPTQYNRRPKKSLIKVAEEEIVCLAQREAIRDEHLALSLGKPMPQQNQRRRRRRRWRHPV